MRGEAQPSSFKLVISILGIIFICGLGSAAISALIVCYTGAILGVGNNVARGLGQIPANTNMHILSYIIGLPLSFVLMWFLLWKKGRPFYWLLKPLMFEKVGN